MTDPPAAFTIGENECFKSETLRRDKNVKNKFRYEHVRDAIRHSIETDVFRENDPIPLGVELAEQFDVSLATVNRALKDLVAERYLKRIPKKGTIVRARNEWNNAVATRSYLIGVIVYDVSGHPLWSIALRGIEDAVQAHGYNLLVGNDDGDFAKAMHYVRQFVQRGVDGIAYVPIGSSSREAYEELNSSVVATFEKEGVPYVQFHRTVGTPPVAVTLDDYRDARVVVAKMMENGCRRPICVSHYYSSCSADREEAFVDELRAHGIADAEALVIRLHPSGQKTGREQIPELRDRMRQIARFDGVFAVETDTLEVAREAEKQVVHGEPNMVWACVDYSAAPNAPGIADYVIAPPTYNLGYVTGESLIAQIDNSQSVPRKVIVPSRIVIADRQ